MKPIMAPALCRTLLLACMGLGRAALCALALQTMRTGIGTTAGAHSVARGWYHVGRIGKLLGANKSCQEKR